MGLGDMAAIGRRHDAALALFLVVATLALFRLDHVARFYQGDSTAYFSTGLSGFVPLDRSWAYGYAGRWLITVCRSSAALVAVQSGLLALGLFALQRAIRARSGGLLLPALLPGLLVLDPLNQALARFWLTDAPACALFLCFLACVPGFAWRGSWTALVLAAVAITGTIFLRLAYVPIALGTLLCCAAVSYRPGGAPVAGLRRRLLLLCVLPVAATVLLGALTSRVVMPPERGEFIVNRNSQLYMMGVFLPALRLRDFERAGVPMSQSEFDALQLGRYDRRESAIWADGPSYLRWLMQQRLHREVKDPAFEAACGAVVRSALLHHPQDLARTYAWSTLLYLLPERWHKVFWGEMGFRRALPEWVPVYIAMIAQERVQPDMSAVGSPLPTMLHRVLWIYPVLLVLGTLASLRLLLRRAPLGGADLMAAAMLAAFASLPLYSHALKPRYALPAVLLGGWTAGIVAANRGRVARPSEPPLRQ